MLTKEEIEQKATQKIKGGLTKFARDGKRVVITDMFDWLGTMATCENEVNAEIVCQALNKLEGQ